jgi:hypothetical protein
MEALRVHDQTTLPPDRAQQALDLQPFLGKWRKTNHDPQWLHGFEIAARGDKLVVHAFGDEDSPGDWGTSTADALFANAIDSTTGAGFMATYELDSMTCTLQGNVNLGLLVVACFTTFRDGSGRSDCFTREFFHHA